MSKQIEREYYLPSGSDLEKAMAFIDRRKACFEAWRNFTKEIGADNAVNNGRRLSGFAFAEQPGAGWKYVTTFDGVKYWWPKKNSKANKEIIRRAYEHVAEDGQAFHLLFSDKLPEPIVLDGRGMISWVYISFDFAGDTVILTAPVGTVPVLADPASRKVLTSEYWRMKEAAAEARQEGGAA